MADEIPEWVWGRVDKLCGDETTGSNFMAARWFPSVRAFARYIMEHEEEPVDPLAEALETFGSMPGSASHAGVGRRATVLREALARHGLKVVKAGELAKDGS